MEKNYKYRYIDNYNNCYLMNNLHWKKFLKDHGCVSVKIRNADTNQLVMIGSCEFGKYYKLTIEEFKRDYL